MTEQTPAGWHVDPFGRFDRRYWDGSHWTQHVGTGGRQGTDQPVHPPAAPTANAAHSAAGWYPDPTGNGGRRYWDGLHWTQHAGTGGRQGTDQPIIPVMIPPASQPNRKVARQARKAGAGAEPGGGTLFTEQVLVVNQKAKVFGSTLGYAVYNQNGQQLGTVQEVRRDLSTKVTDGLLGRPDSKKMHRFRLVDMNGRLLLQMTRPQIGFFRTKGKLVIEGSGGTPIGQIVLESFGVWRRARFGLVAGGQRLGSIHAESDTKWDFNVQDPNGTEVARITKTWAGWAKERFTKADNYVVQMHRPLEEPLRSLVIAAALAIDVEFKQNGVQTASSGVLGTRRYA